MLLFQKSKNRHREESQTTRRSMIRFMDRFTFVRNDVRAVPERSRRAFTLVEIMIVVAIIALLASIAIPNLQRANEEAQISNMKKNLRTFADAYEMYNTATGDFPTNLTSLTGANPPYLSAEMANLCNDAVQTNTATWWETRGTTTTKGFRYSCGFGVGNQGISNFIGTYKFYSCTEKEIASGGECYQVWNFPGVRDQNIVHKMYSLFQDTSSHGALFP